MTKKVLTIFGSYVENGNTHYALEQFLKGIQEKHQIEHHLENVCRNQVEPCHACMACRSKDELYCSMNDRAFELVKEIVETDIVIFAFPCYWFHMPAPVKAFLDRMTAFLHNQHGMKPSLKENFKKKQFICIEVAGGMGLEPAIDCLKTISQFLCFKFDSIGFNGCVTHSTFVNDPKMMQDALDFGRKIADQL